MLKRILFYPIFIGHLLFSGIFFLYEENKYELINQMNVQSGKINDYLSPDSDTVLFITMMLSVSLVSACILLIFTLVVLRREEKIITGFLLIIFSGLSIWRLLTLGGENVSIHGENINNDIAQIQETIVDLTSTWDVFRSEIFRDIYKNPEMYLTGVISLLSNEQVNDTQKTIAALSVQNLPLPKFLFFAKKVLSLREENKISEEVFRIAIFPPYDWNTRLHENYTDQAVREFLITIKSSSVVGKETKEYIDQMITGKTLEEIKLLIEMEQLPILKRMVK